LASPAPRKAFGEENPTYLTPCGGHRGPLEGFATARTGMICHRAQDTALNLRQIARAVLIWHVVHGRVHPTPSRSRLRRCLAEGFGEPTARGQSTVQESQPLAL
jgi:hypothetical protein